VAQQLLNASQISSSFEEVCRCAVTQAVGAEIRGSRDAGETPVDQVAHRPGVNPSAAHT